MLNCIDRVRVMKPLLSIEPKHGHSFWIRSMPSFHGASLGTALWVRTMRKSCPFE